ncbi:M16 family metallopeptidase [Leptolyngbya sp. PCC 6406]|uniref:M16 family metallopeptidase n=1 Tax=Leptolyngbya sp. PCC 6406 TaxID=1173264 RepID=UPI0002ABB42F|nr:pitrilysin family protein [Leptolyngbya sp. PCC 6406]
MSLIFPRRRRVLLGCLGAIVLALTLVLGWQSPAAAVPARHYTDLTFPPLRDIQIPDFERYELDNGLVVYLMEDHELPLVSGSATFRTGERLVDRDRTGLGSLTGQAMRLGGTDSYSADDLNQRLEQRAAAVETSIDTDVGSASFSTLTEDMGEVFALFADVLQHPAFAQDKIDLLKTQYRGGIERRNDDPDAIASREFRKLVYGADSAYARTVEYATLNAISRDDIASFCQASVRPDQTILGIVGDFDPAQMKAMIATVFDDWRSPANTPTLPPTPTAQQAQTGLFFVDQPQLTQSYVQIGHVGGQLNSSAHPAMAVLNEVLNGFGGRLFNEVRSRQGLAYVVYAYWSARFDYPGLFIGGGQTRSQATVPFIQAVKDELNTVRTTPITQEELDRAKDSVLNSFVFNFQNPSQTLSRLIRYEYYGYPEDFVFQFRQAVSDTTTADVLRAAQAQIRPEDLVVLVVGNGAEIQPPLSTLTPDGTVTPVDITIPTTGA